MLRIIKFLVFGTWKIDEKLTTPQCFHTWDIIRQTDVYSLHHQTIPEAELYTLRCNKCGDIKVRKVSGE